MATKLDSTCLQKAAPDEPIFVLRGQDSIAPLAIKHYALALEKVPGVPEEKKKAVWEAAFAMEEWQKKHKTRVKVPD